MTMLGAAASPAFATDPEMYGIPRAITIRQLDRYAQRLDLSLAQWMAMQRHHSDYMEEYGSLRHDRIDPYFDGIVPLESPTFRQALDSQRRSGREIDRHRRSIAALDRGFFLKVEALLAEPQVPAMTRVRLDRRRAFTFVRDKRFPRPGLRNDLPDLSIIVGDMHVTNAEREILDPMLDAYERQLTSLAERATELSRSMIGDVLEVVVEQGFGEEQVGGNDIWRDAHRVYLEGSRGRRLTRLLRSVQELNMSTARAFENGFAGERREEWRDRHVELMYRDASEIRRFRRRVLDSIARLENTSPQQQAFLDELVIQLEGRLDRRLEEEIAISEAFWDPRWPQEEFQRIWEETIAVWNTTHHHLNEIRDWARGRLEESLSPDQFARWDAAYESISSRRIDPVTHASGRAVQMLVKAELIIARRELERLADRFDLDQTQRDQLDSLHESYTRDSRTADFEQAESSDTRNGPLSPTLIDSQLRRDARLLDGVRGIVGETAHDLIGWIGHIHARQLRSRNIHVCGAGDIDPASLVLDAQLDSAHLAAVVERANRFNREAAALYQARHESAVRFYKWKIENDSQYGSDDPLDALNRQIAVLNDVAMRELAAALPEPTGPELLDTFLRACHPYIYRDQTALHASFRIIQRREDLSLEQRRQVADLFVEYVAQHVDLTGRLVEMATPCDAWVSGEDFLVPLSEHGHVEGYAPIHRRRSELNATTNVQLRLVLGSDLIESIGGLPELK